MLAPLLRNAGYRVSFAGDAINEPVAVIVTASASPAGIDAPVVRLRSKADKGVNDDSIYRNDREGLLAALGHSMHSGGAADEQPVPDSTHRR